MFSGIIRHLQEGEVPPSEYLLSLLKISLVKKQGVLQQPKACWSIDPKINPNAVHMFWAAVILEDIDAMFMTAGMIEFEISSAQVKSDLNEYLKIKLAELESLSSDQDMTEWLKKKIVSASEKLGLSI